MAKKKPKTTNEADQASQPGPATEQQPDLAWVKAAYCFHTFAYRDPRSAFSSGIGLPVVSPTTVLLGIGSALFNLGEAERAHEFLAVAHLCRVLVDAPKGMMFFRAFHQLRRYESGIMKTPKAKFKPNARLGLTLINQGTREYGLPDGSLRVYVGAPKDQVQSVSLALRNRDHLGTHDSLCSLVGDVEFCDEPKDVVYLPLDGDQLKIPEASGLTVVTLSRFKGTAPIRPTVGHHWWMSGGDDTELVPYLIKGRFRGTTRGKIYTKG
jgi:hypothetical protein